MWNISFRLTAEMQHSRTLVNFKVLDSYFVHRLGFGYCVWWQDYFRLLSLHLLNQLLDQGCEDLSGHQGFLVGQVFFMKEPQVFEAAWVGRFPDDKKKQLFISLHIGAFHGCKAFFILLSTVAADVLDYSVLSCSMRMIPALKLC